jgi:hypothetical protein
MTIDGTRYGEVRLIEVSDSEALIELKGHAADQAEFFLLVTEFGNAVFRRCKKSGYMGRRYASPSKGPTSEYIVEGNST